MRRYVLDPGHGGHERSGRSTPIGVTGPRGLAEKDVTLQVAKALERLLPGALLTRSDDRNLALGARAAAARRAGADVFLSLHANGEGATGRRGAEVWIHPRAGDRTRALAARVQRALASATPGGAALKIGELAVLDPARLGGRAEACLLELDYLSHPDGERRLADPREVQRIARTLADAVRAQAPAAVYGDRAAARALQAVPARAVAPQVEGIDIFSPNRVPDWISVVNAGFRFAFVKSNEIVPDDPPTTGFSARWPELRDARIIRGSFDLVRHNAGSATAQANAAADVVKRLLPGDLGPTFDLEDRGGPKSSDFWIAFAYEYFDRIEARLGRRPMIFTSRSFWHEFVLDAKDLDEYPLWVIDINNAVPNLPLDGNHNPVWPAWTFWQFHTEESPPATLPAPFKDNGVDIDHFNGTIYELRGLADLGHTAPHVAGNTLFVAYTEVDEHLHLFAEKDAWIDSDVSSEVHGPPLAIGDPAAVGLGDEQVIVYRAADDHIYALNRVVDDPAGWSWRDVTSATGVADALDDPCVAVLYKDEIHVAYWGADDHQHHLMRVAGQWHAEDMGGGAPLASGSAAIYLREDDSYHVVSRAGRDGHLYDLFHVNGANPPQADDLTTGAHTAGGDPVPPATYRPAVYTPAGAAPRIVFRAVRGDIWQIERDTLVATNISAEAGHAPHAAGSPTAAVAGGSEPHVIYRALDGTLVDMWNDGMWRRRNIPCDVRAAADPTAFLDGENVAVTFQAADGSIHLARLVDHAWSCELVQPPEPPPAPAD
jgi:GH25 family lysozyme M1 (1,4-beta-N-acetylmuramidase)